MRHGLHPIRGALVTVCLAALAGSAIAQTGRVGGIVKDEPGQPIKGATVTAENPNASPSSFTATTDDKGRFSIIGLKTGQWTFTAQAPGFAPETGQLLWKCDCLPTRKKKCGKEIDNYIVGTPVVLDLVLGDRSRPLLDDLKTWMARNNAVIMAVLLLVFGAKLVGDAVSGFSA